MSLSSVWLTIKKKADMYMHGASDEAQLWWTLRGKAMAKRIAASAYGQIMAIYEPRVVEIVLGIAEGTIKPSDGQGIEAFALQQLNHILDANEDGKINQLDLNTKQLVIKSVVALMRSFGQSQEEQVTGLKEYLQSIH